MSPTVSRCALSPVPVPATPSRLPFPIDFAPSSGPLPRYRPYASVEDASKQQPTAHYKKRRNCTSSTVATLQNPPRIRQRENTHRPLLFIADGLAGAIELAEFPPLFVVNKRPVISNGQRLIVGSIGSPSAGARCGPRRISARSSSSFARAFSTRLRTAMASIRLWMS
jgi:hypothetical protein